MNCEPVAEKRRTLPVVEEEPLPELYRGWLRQILPGRIPRESRATCNDCAMVSSLGVADKSVTPTGAYDAQTKCCTYLPELPNFLIGGVFRSGDAESEGAETVRERIQRGSGVSPLGLARTAVFDTIYGTVGSSAFGRSPSLRCPHYLDQNGGQCGIWSHRNSVCTTWFCKHGRGSVGGDFWREVQRLLGSVERELRVWCCLEMGMSARALSEVLRQARRSKEQMLKEELVTHNPQPSDTLTWGEWKGREIEFYIGCSKLVSALDWAHVSNLSGQEVRAGYTSVCATYAELISPRIPSVLREAPLAVEHMEGGHVRFITYRSSDPLIVSQTIWQHLSAFDGRPLESVLATLPEKVRRELEDEGLLQRLVDFRILEEST